MKRVYGRTSGILAASLIGFLTFGNTAFAQQVSRQQIIDALTAQPKVSSFAQRLGPVRALTSDDRSGGYAAASTQLIRAIDLEVHFDFNSAEITPRAEPQLRELGGALSYSGLKGATISINGHTDGVGGDTFNKRLSERRAAMIKDYLVNNFGLSASDLVAVGYGKSRLKNMVDPSAPENRRVEVVNLPAQIQARR